MRPPQHAIDSSPILVLEADPAWDDDRIVSECEDLTAEEKQAHPYAQYMNGHTRYDLTAKSSWKGSIGSTHEYLNDGAVMYHLQRLSMRHLAEVQDAMTREFNTEGGTALLSVWLKAAGYGLKDITGADDLSFNPGPNAVPERVLRSIMDNHGGFAAITKIGAAAWTISQAISDAEKKP